MTAFQQYVDLTRILQEENEEFVRKVVEFMQKNISIGYVSKLVKKYTNVPWDTLPANEITDVLVKEGLLYKEYQYCGRDDTHGCLIFMPRGGYLPGSVKPESIINAPEVSQEKDT
jgi:hypothetical protein